MICPEPLEFEGGKTRWYNEYVVFDTKQIRFRYLVKVKFSTKSILSSIPRPILPLLSMYLKSCLAAKQKSIPPPVPNQPQVPLAPPPISNQQQSTQPNMMSAQRITQPNPQMPPSLNQPNGMAKQIVYLMPINQPQNLPNVSTQTFNNQQLALQFLQIIPVFQQTQINLDIFNKLIKSWSQQKADKSVQTEDDQNSNVCSPSAITANLPTHNDQSACPCQQSIHTTRDQSNNEQLNARKRSNVAHSDVMAKKIKKEV